MNFNQKPTRLFFEVMNQHFTKQYKLSLNKNTKNTPHFRGQGVGRITCGNYKAVGSRGDRLRPSSSIGC